MRKKTIYAVIVTGVIAASLTGCGNKTTETEVTAPETKAAETEAAQTEAIQKSAATQNESESAEQTEDSANGNSAEDNAEATLADGSLQVALATLGDQVAFVDYDSNGTAMQVMLYKDTEGKVHGALNTCQVCAGSPYAYFEQEGNEVVCQNCGNHFSVEAIGDVHGGCNPVPLEVSEDGDQVLIDTAALDDQADAFANWKKGI